MSSKLSVFPNWEFCFFSCILHRLTDLPPPHTRYLNWSALESRDLSASNQLYREQFFALLLPRICKHFKNDNFCYFFVFSTQTFDCVNLYIFSNLVWGLVVKILSIMRELRSFPQIFWKNTIKKRKKCLEII